MPSQPRVLGLLIALALLSSGGALVAGQYYQFSEYEATTGTIESAGTEQDTAYGPNPPDPGEQVQDAQDEEEAGAVRHFVYSPKATYNYSVGGERYTSTKVVAGRRIVAENRSAVLSVLPARQAGATATVYYHPDDPGDAHLLRRYRFFPAGLLLAAGLLVLTDTLTANLRFVTFLKNRMPIATLERVPGVERTALSNFPDDPTAILDALRRWAGTEPPPIRSGASPAVWALCYLFLLDIAIVYFALSGWPYDPWATVPVFAAAAGFMRMGFLRLVDYPDR